MHGHLMSPGKLLCIYQRLIAGQTLFSEGVWFFKASGMALLQKLGHLYCYSPTGAWHKFHHTIPFPITGISNNNSFQDICTTSWTYHARPFSTLGSLNASSLLYMGWSDIYVEYSAFKTWRGLIGTVLHSLWWEKNDEIIWLLLWMWCPSMPLTTRPLKIVQMCQAPWSL